LVGDIRVIDDLVEIEADVEPLREIVIGCEINGIDPLPGGYLVDRFIDSPEDGSVVTDGKIEFQVEIAGIFALLSGCSK
jgi:hypothetical protein